MNLLAELSNFILWLVAGAVGIVTEGVRRIHSNMIDLKEENKQRQDEIEDLRKHVGLDGDMNGPSRLDELERDIDDVSRTLDRHEVYWTGDPDDPSQLGALGNLYQIRRQLEKIDRRGENNE